MVIVNASPFGFRAALIGVQPLLLQPLALWLTRTCAIETTFLNSADQSVADRCLALAPDVTVVDQLSANGSVVPIVDALRSSLPETKIILLADRADSPAKALAVATGFDGVVGKNQTAETFVSVLRSARGLALPAVGDDSLISSSFAPAPRLTLREREVLRLLAAGLSTPRIGMELHIANNTTRAHVQRVIEKLGAHSKLEAVALARRAGVITC